MNQVTITIGNSYSRIQGLTTEQFRKLKKELSYTENPEAAYFGRGYVRQKSLLAKDGSFPTGLLRRVKSLFPSISYIDTRRVPKKQPKANITCPKPYDWQRLAVETAVNSHRGGVVAVTGTGKSLVIALIASRLNVKTLVVVPTLEIKKQLQEALKSFSVFNVDVENIDSSSLKKQKSYDCLIIDECHHVAAKTYQKLNKTVWTKIYYRYFLTATWGRNNSNENLLFEGIAGEVIYKLSYKEAINKGYITPVEVYYVDLPKQKIDAYTWQEVYKELVVHNDVRNEIIADLLENLATAGLSTLCLVKEIAHGDEIQSRFTAPFANGQDETTRDYIRHFNNKEKPILIATTGLMGEGVDSKPCEYVIIAGLGKAKSAFMQQIGRAVRVYPGKESAKIILFRDASHKFCLRHFKEQCKILKEEYNVIPIKLDI